MYPRILNLPQLVKHRSLFLLGPRQTGKSTLLRSTFPEARFVDLLEANTFRELSAYPETLRQSLQPTEKLIVIDEVQKLPALLDEAQAIIDRDKTIRFILTGSSARRLRRGQANLLAGRAWFCRLHPLVSAEVGGISLIRRLNTGSLPAVLDSADPLEDLRACVGVYLKEEIRAESLVRSVESFSRFLEVAAMTNTHILNYTSVSNDTGIPARTVREHYQILEDTLIGFQLPPFRQTRKRKPVATAKFYFFDVGVANVLMKRGRIEPGSELYGSALEHQVFLELRAYLDYHRVDQDITFWRTHTGHEVDFIVGGTVAIEVKATRRVSLGDLKGLLALDEEMRLERKIIVAGEPRQRVTDQGITVLPVEEFFRQLWDGGLIEGR
ncbi:MAG: ATP-binding protein [Acidobacteria bacterium]|nr:ATP-binding protein [Acidobacteriota bacterium]